MQNLLEALKTVSDMLHNADEAIAEFDSDASNYAYGRINTIQDYVNGIISANEPNAEAESKERPKAEGRKEWRCFRWMKALKKA